MNRITKHEMIVDRLDYEADQEFIENVFELAFGDNALDSDYSYSEVLARLQEFSEQALLYTNCFSDVSQILKNAVNEAKEVLIKGGVIEDE